MLRQGNLNIALVLNNKYPKIIANGIVVRLKKKTSPFSDFKSEMSWCLLVRVCLKVFMIGLWQSAEGFLN